MRIESSEAPEVIDRVVAIARAELAEKTRRETRAYMSARRVVEQDGRPVVKYVHEADTDLWDIHFWLADHDEQSLVVTVTVDEVASPTLRFTWIAAHVRAKLRIASATMTAAEIASRVGIAPTRTHVLGEPRPNGRRHFLRHAWFLERETRYPGDVESTLQELLDEIEPAADRIAALRPECTVSIEIFYDGWSGEAQIGAWMLDSDAIQMIARVGASLSFEVWATGEGEIPNDV